ncbi:MAG: hypothetical protein JWQ90_3939 [Hydrocarboniphaga sp.]|uniref:outer membrane protein n=1 Tax=Hydrocarboniphaga sp. TaxID=2033016 RepID=UPI002606196A|nr:outer membrane beta-barrel protein [Hydrocarboniphaga sp.]MDB5971489.1 hypothetical protein [Hydrocarboniphaga sp.]
MRSSFFCSAWVLTALSATIVAEAAQAEGFYAAGSAAIGQLTAPDSGEAAAARDFPALQADFGSGGVFNLAAGYAGDQIRLELAYVGLKNSIGGAGATTADTDEVTATGPFVNVAYQFFPERRWHPYLGAGLGYLKIDLQSTSESKVSLQGSLGVEYDIFKRLSVGAGLQLISAGNTQFNKNTGNEFAFDYTNTSYGLNLRYNFGS